jgi:CubicO group peptidase (beta-lactamase class C family)
MKKKSIVWQGMISFLLVALSFVSAQPQGLVSANDTAAKIDRYLTQLAAERSFSGGLLIIKDGQTFFSKGYGYADKRANVPFTTTTLASIGSITKAFTATAILKLYQQGKISLTDKLKKFFPGVPNDKESITIHQLLTHSGGFGEFVAGDGGDYEKIDGQEFLKRAFEQPLLFQPGTKAVYTNVGMSILALILEQVSGMDYEAFLKKFLFAPVGIQHLGYHYPAGQNVVIARGYQDGRDWGTHQEHFKASGGGPYWNLKGNGGLQASLDEMALWANAFTRKTILPDSLIEKMFTPYIAEEGTEGRYSFGYGCVITKSRRNTRVIENGGSNGVYFARLLRLPEEGLVFYMVTNESAVPTARVLPNVTQLFFEGRIVEDAFAQLPRFENPLAEKVYQLLVDKGSAGFSQALKDAGLDIQDDMILLEAGERLTEERKFDEAIALYEHYTKAFPQIVVAQNNLGDLYLKKGWKEKAIHCYQQALKLRPGNARAQASLRKLGAE